MWENILFYDIIVSEKKIQNFTLAVFIAIGNCKAVTNVVSLL